MTPIARIAARMTRKGAFYAKKLPWILGLKSRFKTNVGVLAVPKALVSPPIFYHLVTGDYESRERTLLEEHLSPDDRVIELGAGIGFLANVYGKRSPNQPHLAIEASPVMTALVRANTSHLGNVEVLNALAMKAPAADGAQPGEGTPQAVPFHIYDDFWGSSTQPVHLKNPQRHLVETVQVNIVDLDELITGRRVTMLVCDIEGGEYDLVRTFDLNVPKILMELHWRQLGMSRAMEILRIFETRGYDLYGSPEVFIAIKPPGAGIPA